MDSRDGRFVRQAELLQVQQRPGAQVVDQHQPAAVRQLGQLGQTALRW